MDLEGEELEPLTANSRRAANGTLEKQAGEVPPPAVVKES